ncbi:hypothetical protein [Ruegeria sp. Ofav3-42]|uniref:hypothetical protein n=1 Tax=Ruegeria sp. Ofav3-42 TaxID=2917759 RepID=UPI001EF53499|nr:hypothetical protein [Ruegeria sp. Ofav3-42]MCG7522402.1 hypothetical protein [Ruegeria sp. Ofav3-42]
MLWFPSAISEKLGLALIREMGRDPRFAEALKEQLSKAPRDSAKAEMQILSLALEGRIEPVGDAISDRLAQALQDWLRSL